jgi:Na+/proline symporter
MRDYLPAGLKGLVLDAFLSSYMSTISTKLNRGASFHTNDLYKRFIKPEEEFKSEETAQLHYVKMARLFTILIMVVAFFVTTQIHTIDAAAKFLIQAGAGLGMVLILRWYWWRISAWSEISASLAPILGFAIANYYFHWEFPNNFLFTVLFTTVIWISVTFLTKPESKETLLNFYNRVTPPGIWSAYSNDKKADKLGPLFISWASSIVMTYSILFGVGYLVFTDYKLGLIWLSSALVSGIVLSKSLNNTTKS